MSNLVQVDRLHIQLLHQQLAFLRAALRGTWHMLEVESPPWLVMAEGLARVSEMSSLVESLIAPTRPQPTESSDGEVIH